MVVSHAQPWQMQMQILSEEFAFAFSLEEFPR